MILRIIWALKLIPILVILGVPAVILEFPFLILVWLFTGKDATDSTHSPMVWISTGWRWKVFCWPLEEFL